MQVKSIWYSVSVIYAVDAIHLYIYWDDSMQVGSSGQYFIKKSVLYIVTFVFWLFKTCSDNPAKQFMSHELIHNKKHLAIKTFWKTCNRQKMLSIGKHECIGSVFSVTNKELMLWMNVNRVFSLVDGSLIGVEPY